MACRSKIISFFIALALTSSFLTMPAFSEPKKGKSKADQILYENNNKLIKLLGNAEVNINDGKDTIVINSEELFVDQEINKIYTNKEFKMTSIRDEEDPKTKQKTKRTTVIKGKEFNFDLETRRLIVKYASLDTDAGVEGQKIYIKGEEITLYNKGDRISVVNGEVTTCSHEDTNEKPHISIKSEAFEIVPDVSIFAWSPTIKLVGNDTYWLPFIYLPLKKDEKDMKLDIGQNQVEGFFTNYNQYYKLNDYHDGNLFLRVMEKKYFNIGIEHYWIADPTSVSYAFLYGNIFNKQYFDEPDESVKKDLSPYFQDHQIYLRHKQWLPFIPNNEMDFKYNKRNFYNINSVSTVRDDIHEFNFNDTDNEIFELSKDFKITLNQSLNFNLNNTNLIDSNNIFRSKRNIANSKNEAYTTDYNISADINNPIFKDANFSLKVNYTDNVGKKIFEPSLVVPSASPTATPSPTVSGLTTKAEVVVSASPAVITPSPSPSVVPLSTPTPSVSVTPVPTLDPNIVPDPLSYYGYNNKSNWNLDSSLRFKVLPNLSFSGTLNYQRSYEESYKQPNVLGAIGDLVSAPIKNQTLRPRVQLDQDLTWGNLSLVTETTDDFLQEDLYPTDSKGNLLTDSQMSDDQKKKQKEAQEKRKNGGIVTKLPELTLSLSPFSKGVSEGLYGFINPFFRDILPYDIYKAINPKNENFLFKDNLPINMSFVLGNYIEQRRNIPNEISGIKNVSKFGYKFDLGGSDYDLGMGNKINFGGTGYEQRFYSTQDAQYAITGNFNYKNDFIKAFIPNLRYGNIITDKDNNTPLGTYDNLNANKQNRVDLGFDIGNIPEFTLRLNSIGYDFYNKSVASPISIGLNSTFTAGAIFSLSANTSYNISTIKELDTTRINTNFTGIDNLKADLKNTTAINDTAFSDKYAGYSRNEVTTDITTLNDTQLKDKYSLDNRLINVLNSKPYTDTVRLSKADIGRIEPKNSKFGAITLNFGVGTPWDWELQDDRYFGKDMEIPWGIATSLNSTFDFEKEDFYKSTTSLTDIGFNKKISNLSNRFSSTSLDLIAVIGGNWLTHTKFSLVFKLIPPELLAENQTSIQKNRPFFPLDNDITLSIKKDFHDLNLYMDLRSNYNPSLDRNDFSIMFNAELTAFPSISSKNVQDAFKNNVDKLKQPQL